MLVVTHHEAEEMVRHLPAGDSCFGSYKLDLLANEGSIIPGVDRNRWDIGFSGARNLLQIEDGYAPKLGSVPSFMEKEKWRNLLLTKHIAQRGEGGLRHEQEYHD